jgi:hypothetical protein
MQNNKAAWGELIEELEEQHRGLQKYVQQIDDKQAMEESLRPALTAYLRSDKILRLSAVVHPHSSDP